MVEFTEIQNVHHWLTGRVVVQLSDIDWFREVEIMDGEYEVQSMTEILIFGRKKVLLIAFDEFKELYEKMTNRKIVIAT